MDRNIQASSLPSVLASLTARQFLALVYVGIAIAASGLATVQTYTNVQWFSAAGNLDVHVSSVLFHVGGIPLGYPYVIVQATVQNPSTFNGLHLKNVNYLVFVNSTSQAFNPPATGSTQIASFSSQVEKSIPPVNTMNITYAFQINPVIVSPLQTFLETHNTTTDLVTYVSVTLYFLSSVGTYTIPFCYQLPQNVFTICPPTLTAVSRGPGGG